MGIFRKWIDLICEASAHSVVWETIVEIYEISNTSPSDALQVARDLQDFVRRERTFTKSEKQGYREIINDIADKLKTY